MTSKVMDMDPSFPQQGGLIGEMSTCFVCNKQFHNSETAVDEVLIELSQIQKMFFNVFEINLRRKPAPFKENPFCRSCERKAREMQRLSAEMDALREQLDRVRDDMASAIVTTYVYSTKENPNFELKHLIFEKWYDKVDDKTTAKSVSDPIHETAHMPITEKETTPTQKPEIKVEKEKVVKSDVKNQITTPATPSVPQASLTTKPKGSEREIAQLIRQSEERMSCDPNSDKVEEASCYICSKVCRNKELLDIHMKTHAEERPFLCRACGKSFFGKAVLKKHLQLKHPDHPQDIEADNHADSDSSHAHDKVQGMKIPKKPFTRKLIKCEMCGKNLQHRKALQKHIKKMHKLTKRGVTNATKSKSVTNEFEDEYSDHYDEVEQASDDMTISTEPTLPTNNLITDLEDVKKFKRMCPAHKGTNFNISVKIERMKPPGEKASSNPVQSNSSIEPDEEEKERRPAAPILKSVAWKSKGEWFTQEKSAPAPGASTSVSLSNWKTFFQKTQKFKPNPVRPQGIAKIIMSTDSSKSAEPPTPSPSTSVNSTSTLAPEAPAPPAPSSNYTNFENPKEIPTPAPKAVDSDMLKRWGLPVPTVLPGNQSNDTSQTTIPKRPVEPSTSSAASVPPAKRPTDSSYWVDPKNVLQSTAESSTNNDCITTSPYLAQALRTNPSKPGTNANKRGPFPGKKLSDITHALRLGMKKPGRKPLLPPPPRPSSSQITKLARQLRKSGVGTTKGRFDPVFQLHPLGAPNKYAASNVSSTLTLNTDADVPKQKDHRSNSTELPTKVAAKPKPKTAKVNGIPPRNPIPPPRPPQEDPPGTDCYEVETDIRSLMQNSNVMVMPTSQVRTPDDTSQQMRRTIKRMAGPRSKTIALRDVLVHRPQNNSPSASPSPSFRFVDVEDVLSRSSNDSNQPTNTGVSHSGTVTSFAGDLQNRRWSSSSERSGQSFNPVLVHTKEVPSKTKERRESDDVEIIESDSDFEDVPKIRIRNIQSLAEPADEDLGALDDLGDDEDDDDVMELEDAERYAPGVLEVQIPATRNTPIGNGKLFHDQTPESVQQFLSATYKERGLSISVSRPTNPASRTNPPPETYVYNYTPVTVALDNNFSSGESGPFITSVCSMVAEPNTVQASHNSTIPEISIDSPERKTSNLHKIDHEDDLDVLLGL